MRGLCHKCLDFKPDVFKRDNGKSLCNYCYGKLFPQESWENQPEPTLEDLKKHLEKKFED